MQYLFIILINLFIVSNISYADPLSNRLKVFSTDGCSMVSDGVPKDKWLYCCVKHDVEYWMGGSEFDRERTDLELEKCISKKSFPLLGELFYSAVKLGGSPTIQSTWRWGYGWVRNRGYFLRTKEEQKTIINQMSYLSLFFNEEQVTADFPTQNLYCEDSEDKFKITIAIDENQKATGFYQSNTIPVQKFITANITSAIINMKTPLQIVDISENSQKSIVLNLIPSNDCVSSKSNERFLFHALILKHSKDSVLFRLLNKKKICCEILQNKL